MADYSRAMGLISSGMNQSSQYMKKRDSERANGLYDGELVLQNEVNTTSGALSGAAAGASMGAVAGPWGMAAGAVVGGVAGYAMSEKENREIRDRNSDAIAYYNGNKEFQQEYDSNLYGKMGNISITAMGGDVSGNKMPQGAPLQEYVQGSGSHENNQYGGIPVDKNGNPSMQSNSGTTALTEEGETHVGSKVFSDRVVNNFTGNTFSKDAKKIRGKYSLREGEKMTNDLMEAELDSLYKHQENLKNKEITQNTVNGNELSKTVLGDNGIQPNMMSMDDMIYQQPINNTQMNQPNQQVVGQQQPPQLYRGGGTDRDKRGYRATKTYKTTGGDFNYDPGVTYGEINNVLSNSQFNPQGDGQYKDFNYQAASDAWNTGGEYDETQMKAMQQEMYDLGYYNNVGYGEDTNVNRIVDGKPGSRTAAAYAKYQKAMGMANKVPTMTTKSIEVPEETPATPVPTGGVDVGPVAHQSPVAPLAHGNDEVFVPDMNFNVNDDGVDNNEQTVSPVKPIGTEFVGPVYPAPTPITGNVYPPSPPQSSSTPSAPSKKNVPYDEREMGPFQENPGEENPKKYKKPEKPDYSKDYFKDGLKQNAPGAAMGIAANAYDYLHSDPFLHKSVLEHPEYVDYTQQRDAARRAGSTNNAMLKDYITKNGASGGNSMSNMIAGVTNSNDKTGENIGKSWMNEENTNVGIYNKADSANSKLQTMDNENNIEEFRASRDQKIDAVYGMAETGQQYMKDSGDYAMNMRALDIAGNKNPNYGYGNVGGKESRMTQYDNTVGVNVTRDDAGKTIYYDQQTGKQISFQEYQDKKIKYNKENN